MRAALLLAAVALAPTATAQQPKPEPKYEGKPLAYWVERLQKAETDKDRDEAAAALRAFGPDGAPAVPTLMEMLHDRSPGYRNRVAQIMWAIGPGAKAAVPELVKRVKEKYARKPRDGWAYEHTEEIRELARILGAIGPDAKEAVPTLIAVLNESWFQEAGMEALCKIGPDAKAAIPAIRRVMLGAKPGLVPVCSCSVPNLHKLGPDAAPLLFDLLQTSDKSVQRAAYHELDELDPATLQGSATLAKLLNDPAPVTRYHAAVLSWKVSKDKAAITTLAALLDEDPGFSDKDSGSAYADAGVAWAAAAQLGKIGADANDALPALRKASATGFVLWYFVVSRYPRSGNMVYIPTSFTDHSRVSRRIAIGYEAEQATQTISPKTDAQP